MKGNYNRYLGTMLAENQKCEEKIVARIEAFEKNGDDEIDWHENKEWE